jgi:alpha-glucosidase (family GH31 glycosyl hydrolase)
MSIDFKIMAMSISDFFTPPLAAARANPQSIFQFPKVRFTLLTPRLIRMECSFLGQFEDRPSQVFWYRNQPIPKAIITKNDQGLSIQTDAFQLTYHDSPKGLVRESLEVKIIETGVIIHLDDPNPEILAGTARTLDETNGPVELQPGIISRSGWVQLDDTQSLLFDAKGWVTPRPLQSGYRDLYLLISGSDYKAALQEYQLIAGRPSLPPRAFLGNWWSHFWEYSQEDLQNLVERFQQEQIPLSALIIDMDWHITKTGNACSGWTGFSWNRALFPDPPGFLKWLHKQGLITSLNLHPAEGIHPHEENYRKAAIALEMDLEAEIPIPFDIIDPAFTRVYFEEILHPLEDEGVDFWWLDWQQGDQVKTPGLDPLWWLNHLHFFDLGRDEKKRPVIFSRWGGPGNHRYPIGFSGDTVVSWKSLAFQPYFTATAANAAYGWWSHDIGGHMQGIEDGELYTRWVQFGVLSPIFRLHCAKDLFISRLPWAFDTEVLRLTRQCMQFRKALIPYLYTMAWRNEQQGLPLLTPLYYDWPGEESAYAAGGQYLLGNELMAAPVTTPRDPDLNQSRQPVWFPPGEWFDFFNGERRVGPRWSIQYSSLEEMPLFARAGAIIPLDGNTSNNGTENPESINLLVFPGKEGHFTLYEDDGLSQDYVHNGGSSIKFDSFWTDSTISVRISPAVGNLKCIPELRTYHILFRGVDRPDGYNAKLNGSQLNISMDYDETTHTASVGPIKLGISQCLTVKIHKVNRSILVPKPTIPAAVLRLLKLARMETVTKWKISTLIDKLRLDISALIDPQIRLTDSQLKALIEIITGVGAVKINLPEGSSWILSLNPNHCADFKYLNEKSHQMETCDTMLSEELKDVVFDYFGLIKIKL